MSEETKESNDSGCGCLILIILFFLFMTGALTLNCGGIYIGPTPKEAAK